MSQQLINNGTVAGDDTGEKLFSAFAKVNANFTELYGFARTAQGRLNCLSTPTRIPASTGVGTYSTRQGFAAAVDALGTVCDLANGRLNVIAGFKRCKVSYCLAFDFKDFDDGVTLAGTVGWRGARIKNSAGQNYGNDRKQAISDSASTNPAYETPWLDIKTDGSGSAPDSVNVGDYFELYPAQSSGHPLGAGVDLASSWFVIEFDN